MFVFISFAFNAQKVEREFRISQDEFPARAIQFLNAANVELKRVKWYEEIQEDKMSFEAKVKIEKILYSIEFDSLGHIEDIEKLVPFKKLPPGVQHVLCSALKSELGKYKIIKTQIQFTHFKKNKFNLNELSDQNSTVNYEIKLYDKKDKSKRLMEYLVSDKGEILSSQEVIIRSTENLTY